jgi:hypothetical protein
MKDNITPIAHDILATIRATLRVGIVRDWKHRNDPFFRNEVKQAVKALRVIRGTQVLYQEKFFWAK